MRRNTMLQLAMGTFLAVATFAANDAQATPPREVTPHGPGFAGVYGSVPADQAEFLDQGGPDDNSNCRAPASQFWPYNQHSHEQEDP